MSYISQIKTPDGELYDVKDLEAIGYEGIIASELDETGLAAQLKDKQGNKLYPVVDADNVITTSGTDLNTELSNMNNYIDTKTDAVTALANAYYENALEYTDTEVESVSIEVKEYSDTNLAAAKIYAEGQASTALSSAKTYADNLPFSSMTAVTASSEANVGFTNVTTDSKRVPTMSFMAYWNGRYNSSSSNLLYCKKGAFGDLAIINKNSNTGNFLRGDGAWTSTCEGGFSVTGGNSIVTWSGASTGNKVQIYAPASDYARIIATQGINYCCGANHQFRNAANNAWAPAYASAFTNSSSIRYKKNVAEMTEEDAKKILEFRPVTYDYINELDGANCKGLIAEEVYEVQPWGVVFREEEVDGLDYSKFVPQLIKLCQIQQKEIDELKAKIEGGI